MSERFDWELEMPTFPSLEIPEQISMVEKMVAELKYTATALVNCLKSVEPEYKIFVAERIYTTKPLLIEPLKAVFETAIEGEEKIASAVLLLEFGDHCSVEFLTGIFVADHKDSCWAGRTLAEAKIDGVEEKLIAKILTFDIKRVDEILCLLDALAQFRDDLPSVLQQKLDVLDAPWQLRRWLESRRVLEGFKLSANNQAPVTPEV